MPHIGRKHTGSSRALGTTTWLVVCWALGALAAMPGSLLVPRAIASPGIIATGGYAEHIDSFTVRQAGGNFLVDFVATVAFTGAFAGAGTSEGTQVIHPTGALHVHAVIICTCTVEGEVGELVLRFTAIGLFPLAAKDGQFEVSGTGGARPSARPWHVSAARSRRDIRGLHPFRSVSGTARSTPHAGAAGVSSVWRTRRDT